MVYFLRILIFVATFLLGILTMFCGDESDKHKKPDNQLKQKLEFASNPDNRAQFAGWEQKKDFGDEVRTNFRQELIINSKGKREIYFYYLYHKPGRPDRFYVVVHTPAPANALMYEIEDQNIDGIADNESGISVNFPATIDAPSENKRIIPRVEQMPQVQTVYDRALALLPTG